MAELRLRVPELEDLWFREKMLADPVTMAYNHAWGGTVAFSKERWHSWYEKWVSSVSSQRFYRYLVEDSGTFVGEVAYHWDESRRLYLMDVIIHAPFRGHGYGLEGMRLLCREAKCRGIDALYDDIALDNPAIALFLKEGFREISRSKMSILLMKEL